MHLNSDLSGPDDETRAHEWPCQYEVDLRPEGELTGLEWYL
jgi:hypothetical protein